MTTIIQSIYGKDVKIGLGPYGEVLLETKGEGDRLVDKNMFLNTLKSEGILDGTLITDLPVAKLKFGCVEANDFIRNVDQDADELLVHIKALLAIHAFLVKRNAEQEAAAKAAAEEEAVKAKEAARAKRREELIVEFRSCGWDSLNRPAKEAYDRIIDLEEAAKVS